MRFAAWLGILFDLAALPAAFAEDASFSFPLIERYGGVAAVAEAAEQPLKGGKAVFDITADSKVEEINRGLESVARYLNLNAQAGNAASDVTLALVLHGGATKCALNDVAFQRHTGAKTNPNLPLLSELRRHGVEVFVCGQSLARNKHLTSDVAGDVTVAASAMTVNVNKQLSGYAYLSIH